MADLLCWWAAATCIRGCTCCTGPHGPKVPPSRTSVPHTQRQISWDTPLEKVCPPCLLWYCEWQGKHIRLHPFSWSSALSSPSICVLWSRALDTYSFPSRKRGALLDLWLGWWTSKLVKDRFHPLKVGSRSEWATKSDGFWHTEQCPPNWRWTHAIPCLRLSSRLPSIKGTCNHCFETAPSIHPEL